MPPPRRAPVKIIRPPKEPVASISKIKRPVVKVTPRTSSQSKVRLGKPTLHNPPKKPAPTQQPSSPRTAVSPPPPPPVPFVPSDLYISLMSRLAMANMPQAMQVAATTDPMAAFQLAQMYFASPSPFPLPPFSLVPPRPDPASGHRNIHAPNLPPKPISNPTTKSNPKMAPVSPLVPSSVSQDNPNTTPPSTSAGPSSLTAEMDPLMLKQKRQARKNSIGWIPEPGFPGRGIFDLVPTIDYVRWSASDDFIPPDPRRSLVMEDIPCDCRTVRFIRSWADQFSATAIYLNGNAKALIEFPSREVADLAYDSPRLRGGQFDRATHVRVFWYRPQVQNVVPPSIVTTNEKAGATGDPDGFLDGATSQNIATTLEEPMSMTTDDLSLKAGASEIEKGALLKRERKASPLHLQKLDLPDFDLPVRSPTVPTFAPRPGPHLVASPSMECDQGEQGRRASPVDRATNVSREGSERGTSRPLNPLSPSEPRIPRVQIPTPLFPPSLEAIPRKRTPSGSPPSLRYPSSTPEMTNDKKSLSPPSEETSVHDTLSPTSTPNPSVAGDYSLEQKLRMRLLAKIANRNREQSFSPLTVSAIAEHDSDTFFITASPPSVSRTPSSVAISESL